MTKRILALVLCVVTLLPVFAGCSKHDENYKGQSITMYLTTDVYDLDPVHAFYNESLASVVGLMFETLFTLDDNGKVQKGLAKSYKIYEDEVNKEYKMEIELKETKWSNGSNFVTADDVAFAWRRLLEMDGAHEAAALLYDIKNARAAKAGDASIYDVMIRAEDTFLLSIEFEGKIDYDQFLLNLTSIALAPLHETTVSRSDDWAKKPGTMVCSGPFRLGRITMVESGAQYSENELLLGGEDLFTSFFDPSHVSIGANGKPQQGSEAKEQLVSSFILERNTHYYRDNEEDSLFKTVLPYRLCVDCTMTPAQLEKAWSDGLVMYIGDIPLQLRQDENSAIAQAAVVAKKSLSTNVVYLNETAMIADGTETGTALFAEPAVRQALSMAIDRETIAKTIVYAEAATGLIPTGVWETGKSAKKSFRDACSAAYDYLKTDLDAAKALLSDAGITPGLYSFSLTCAAYDDVHCAIADMIATAWGEDGLGFDVTVKKIGTIPNNDKTSALAQDPPSVDICDDLYAEELRSNTYEAILLDSCALSVDPFAYLAPYALDFSGQGCREIPETQEYISLPHPTGYNSAEYNALIEKIFDEKTIANRASDLRKAEEMLMTDLPVIPVVFNYTATVKSKELKGLDSDYFIPANFEDAKLSDKAYNTYLEAGYNYIHSTFFAKQNDSNAEEFMLQYSRNFAFKEEPDLNERWTAFAAASTVYSHFIEAHNAANAQAE